MCFRLRVLCYPVPVVMSAFHSDSSFIVKVLILCAVCLVLLRPVSLGLICPSSVPTCSPSPHYLSVYLSPLSSFVQYQAVCCLLCYGSMFPVSVYPCSGSCVGFFMFSFPSLGYCLFSSLFALCITLYFFISALNGSLFLNTQVLVPRSFVSAFWVLFATPYSLSPPDCDTVVLIQLASFLKKSEDHFQSSRYCMLNSNA